jgi:hypothetical protein
MERISMNEPNEEQRALAVAEQIVNDIKALRESQPFKRYFLARLERRRSKMLTDAVIERTPEAREKCRVIFLEYEDEITKFMDRDFAASVGVLESQGQPVADGAADGAAR